MKKTLITMLASMGLLAANLAHAQEGGGEVSGSVSAGGEASTGTPPPAAGESSSGGAGAGKMGFGAALTLSDVGGLEGTYHLSDKLMINAMLAFASFSPNMGDGSTTVGFAASGFFNLFPHSWADLYGGARLGYLQGQSNAGGTGNVDASEVIIELPLRLELKLHRRFSIHFETGIAIDLITLKAPGGNQSFTHFGLGAGGNGLIGLSNDGNSGIFATGGFTIYI